MEVRYILAMKMKLDDPSFISTPTAPAAPFSAEKNPAVLADAFTEAWRHASRPPADPDIPKPPALVWAGTTTAGLVARFNEHPEVRAAKSVAAVYNGAVVLTDLRGPRPQFTEAQDQAVLALRKLPSHLLAHTSDAYSVARESGRLATWPSVKTAWDAAVARSDSNNQRVCAFAARAMDHMTQSFYPAPLPPPPRKQDAAAADFDPVFDEPVWRETAIERVLNLKHNAPFETVRFPPAATAAIAMTQTDPRIDYERLRTRDVSPPLYDFFKDKRGAFGDELAASEYVAALALATGTYFYQEIKTLDLFGVDDRDDPRPFDRRFEVMGGRSFDTIERARAHCVSVLEASQADPKVAMIRAGISIFDKNTEQESARPHLPKS